MGDKSKIEWTNSTWNPVRAQESLGGGVGWHCEHVSDGCRNCYAETMNKRLGTGAPYKPGVRADLSIYLDEKMLLAPLRWKRPRMIFVGSMTDLFADFVTDEMLDRIFAVMALCPQHTFQVLTKRSARMRAYCTDLMTPTQLVYAALSSAFSGVTLPEFNATWPLPNVWFGISAEDQAAYDDRYDDLERMPAAVRWISCEPLLAAIDLFWTPWINPPNWIVAGGESGPHARPMHPDWVRSLRDQCAAAGVPFFFKQWGEWADIQDWLAEVVEHYDVQGLTESGVVRVGKKAAGRLLDGVLHDAMPAVRA